MSHSSALVLFAVFASAGFTAFAQSPATPGGNPSTQQIINALTPTGTEGATRGIRLVRPGEQASPQQAAPATKQPSAGRQVAAGTPAGAVRAPSVSLMVLFPTNSAELTPEAVQVVDQLGEALKSQQLSGYRFRVEGHTDTVGSPGYNKALSQRRADAVVSYLEQKFGIPATRLEPVGVGEAGLAVPTGDQVAEPRNRRVQVVNLGS
jgi:OOP family OmpA-OmpF porin